MFTSVDIFSFLTFLEKNCTIYHWNHNLVFKIILKLFWCLEICVYGICMNRGTILLLFYWMVIVFESVLSYSRAMDLTGGRFNRCFDVCMWVKLVFSFQNFVSLRCMVLSECRGWKKYGTESEMLAAN